MASVFIKTLGCKVNTYDTQALEQQFLKLGYQIVDNPEGAAVTVINTCSVTENADKEARYLARRFRRDNPETLLVATGCYAQTDSARLVEMSEIDLVFPNQWKDTVASASAHALSLKQQGSSIKSKLPDGAKPVSENKQGHFKTSLKLLQANSSQTRAFLKIQDGCNGFCSYCLIPYARGASRSVPSAELIQEIRRLIDQGSQEIVFTGIHLGDYGEDLEEKIRLNHIINEIFSWPDMVRLRISSLEPRELSEDLLKTLSQRPELFCDHFHLPLQSGNDRILKLMRRTYDTKQYADNLAMARSYFPNAMFGADVIPGFPSETDEEFEHTLSFIRDCGLHYIHSFPYSVRPNTAAARMPDHIDPAKVKSRSDSLRELSNELKPQYLGQFIGKEQQVLWEERFDKQGRRLGLTRNYIEVAAPRDAKLESNTLSTVKLKGFVEDQRMLGLPLS